MARPLKVRLVARAAAVALAASVATLGLASTAQAGQAAQAWETAQGAAAADRPSIAAPSAGIQAGPYSPWPGQWWYWQGAYASKNTCDYNGFLYVLYGYATGSTCALRYDYSGYDLWLRA